LNLDKDKGFAITLTDIGCCYSDMNNYDEALFSLNRSLQIKQNITLNVDKDEGITVTL